MPSTCPSCAAADNVDGAHYCRRCGGRLPVTADAAATGAAAPTRRRRSGTASAPPPGVPAEPAGAVVTTGAGTLAAEPAVTGPATPVGSGRPSLVPCPACGAPNSPRRILCGRCAADLETGELVARPQPRVFPPPRSPADDAEAPRRPSRTLAVTVVTVVLGVATLLAVLAEAGAGPFAEDRTVPRAVFEQARYGSVPGDLPVSFLSTSSTLAPTGDETFDADQMADGDLTTAWNSDGAAIPEDAGEVVRADFAAPVWLGRIVIGNGAQRDDASFLANGRVARAQVTLDGGVTFTVDVLDRQGLQVIALDRPELTTAVQLEVLDVHPGATNDNLAISELRFLGHVADERDQAIGRRRAELRPVSAAT